jgi:hypothetical protein
MTPVLRLFAPIAASCLAASVALAAHVSDFNVADFGANGRDIHNDTAAIQKAIDTCSSQGGGRVVIPAGSSVHDRHDRPEEPRRPSPGPGRRLLEGSPTYADYTRFAPQPVAFDPGARIPMMGVVVYADGAEDIADHRATARSTATRWPT